MEYSGARPAVAISSANRPGTQHDANVSLEESGREIALAMPVLI
jgi:hypothetical protein